MYVPATSAQPALNLAPAGIVSEAPPILRPLHTTLLLKGADLNVLEGHASSITGALRPGLSGRTVTLQWLTRHGWRTLTRTRSGLHGRFDLRFVPRQTGSELVRVSFSGDASHLATHRRVGTLNSYRVAVASWYGGGGQTACGGSLTSSTLGVANKTLPCGTLVTLRYGGRTVRVPVIDRGPFVPGREFDLTEATKRALGFGDLGEVWSTS
jgi:rare lipoprotein A